MQKQLEMLSLIIPTYNEKDNLPELVKRIAKEFKTYKISGEVIIVDDGSPDGTGKLVEKMRKTYSFLRVIHRSGKLGLSSAVVTGFRQAKGTILGVMDADLSHPPEKIHELYFSIAKKEADIAIGSRYIAGGAIEGWGAYRKLQSRVATYLARPYTLARDPMGGFFFVKRKCLDLGSIDSKGFKILLEVLIKATYSTVKEIPYVFINRKKGKSKASAKEVLLYIVNISSYLKYKKNLAMQFLKFLVVGFVGMLLNLGLLYALTDLAGIHYMLSAVFSFLVATLNNYVLNKIWTFRKQLRHQFLKDYLSFFAVSTTALAINLVLLYSLTEFLNLYYLISQIIAIGGATLINFLGNKLITFAR